MDYRPLELESTVDLACELMRRSEDCIIITNMKGETVDDNNDVIIYTSISSDDKGRIRWGHASKLCMRAAAEMIAIDTE